MDINTVKQLTTSTLGRTGLMVRKHSPAILTAVGIVGTVTSTVMAAKATLKLEPIVDSLEEDVALAKSEGVENEQKEITRAYVKASVKIAKLYGPAFTTGVASIGCLIGAQGIMHKRNVALAAAYKTVEEGFARYRNRVVEEFGEDKDFELSNGKVQRIERKNEETGEMETREVLDPNGVSVHAKFFDELCPNWVNNAEYNLMFLKCQQDYANDMLRARGHLFLNDVYDMLGLERTQSGAVVGWVLDGAFSSNYVDFGIFDSGRERARAFVNGAENAILLDFNVDGVVFDKI